MDPGGDRFTFSASGASQAEVDTYLPNGTTFRMVMLALHDGTRMADLAISGNAYPNTPLATNYAAMQAVQPNSNFTIYWNAFTGGTTNDLIIASLVCANRSAPYGSFLNSPLPRHHGCLKRHPAVMDDSGNYLQPNSNYWARIVFYKVVTTNKTAYFVPGVTGYGVYGKGTTVPLVTTSAAVPKPVITVPPASQTVYVEDNVLMSVTATGTGLSYQWRRSNTNLVGAAASAYSIPNAQVGNAGNYSAVVSSTGRLR